MSSSLRVRSDSLLHEDEGSCAISTQLACSTSAALPFFLAKRMQPARAPPKFRSMLLVSFPACTDWQVCSMCDIILDSSKSDERQTCCVCVCVCITGFLMKLHLPVLKSQGRLQQWAGTSRTPLSLLAGQFMLHEADSVLLFLQSC